MLREMDRFVGKWLYVPVIIFACQRTGLTQYAVSRYALMVGCWLVLLDTQGESIAWSIVAGIAALLMTIIAALIPDQPAEPSSHWWRVPWLLIEPVHWLGHALGQSPSQIDITCAFGQCFLIAEYARTIRTIPPREAWKLSAVKPARAER